MSAPLDLNKIRDNYRAQLGHLRDARLSGSLEAPFFVLTLEPNWGPFFEYVSFGASGGPLGDEIFLRATERLPAYGAAIEAVARAGRPIAPFAVIPHVIPDTPFTALLVLPEDAKLNWSFKLSRASFARTAYLATPLTAAEQAVAERDPKELLPRLRYACAIEANRWRDDLVDVPPPPPAATTEIAQARRRERAALLELHSKLWRENVSGVERRDAMTDHRIPPGFPERVHGQVDQMVRNALLPYAHRHPGPVSYLMGELIYLTMATHPDALRILDRVVDPRPPPPVSAAALSDPARAAAVTRRVVEGLVIGISRFHRAERVDALLARAEAAVTDALATFDPEDEIPVENHLWAEVLPVLYEGLADLEPPAVRGMPKVFRVVAKKEALLEYEPDPRPPLMRAGNIAARIATEQVIAYAEGLRHR